MKRRFLAVILAAMMMGNSSVTAIGAEAEVDLSAQEQVEDLEEAYAFEDIAADVESAGKPEDAETAFEENLSDSYVSPGVPKEILGAAEDGRLELLEAKNPWDEEMFVDIRNQPKLRNRAEHLPDMNWAYAVNSLAEFNLSKKGYYNPYKIDFSELYLGYATAHRQNDIAEAAKADSYVIDDYMNLYREDMEMPYYLAASILGQWTNIADESEIPAEKAQELSESDAIDAPKNKARLINFFKVENPTAATIQKYIYEYGAVGVALSEKYHIEWGDDLKIEYDNNRVDFIKKYYFTGGMANTYYSIVGWTNDCYILRNSRYVENVQNQGPFTVEIFDYLSYFLMPKSKLNSLSFSLFVFDFETPDIYDHNYQYDGGIAFDVQTMDSSHTVDQVANIFEAEGHEILKAVRIYGKGNYKIEVYKLNSGYGNDPTNGTLESSQLCELDNIGYYTIDLKDTVELQPESKFSVVLSGNEDNEYYSEKKCFYKYNVCFNVTAEPGQSFVHDGSGWNQYINDIPDTDDANFAIKAFTKDYDKLAVDPESIEILNIDGDEIELVKGEEKNIISRIMPAHYSNSSEVVWSSSDNAIATVTGSDENAKVTGNSPGEATITAITKTGGATASFKVIVRKSDIPYTIDFNANGGANEMPSVNGLEGEELTLPNNLFTKNHYSFKCWNTKADGSGDSYSDGETVVNIAEAGKTVTLYAQWEANSYTITFNGNGGTPDLTTRDYVYGEKYGEFPEVTRDGYDFQGWYTEESGGSLVTTDSEIDPDNTLTLYAHWVREKYKIKFDPNGGKGTMAAMEVQREKSVNLTANSFTRAGYKFINWNTKADGSGDDYTDKQSVTDIVPEGTKEITLYAQWKGETYIIYYTGNGGRGTMAPTNTEYGKKVNLSANQFVYDGYRFVGWNTKEDGTGDFYKPEEEVIDLVTIKNGTILLYAQWRDKNDLLVTFDGNGGLVTVTEKYVRNGKTYGVLPQASMAGFRFTGWALDADGSTVVARDTVVTKKADHTLYAKWMEDETVQIFDGDTDVTEGEISVKAEDATGVALKAQITPTTVSQLVSWSSSDTKKATVNENGLVIGINPGYVFVTATSKADASKSARVRVHITDADPTQAVVSGSSYLRIGEEEKYKAVVTPANAPQTVVWSIVSAINSNGENAVRPDEYAQLEADSGSSVTLTAMKAGKIVLAATSTADSEIFAQKEITILPETAERVTVTLKSGYSDEINIGEKTCLKASITPASALQSIKWESNNEAIAVVDSDGFVTGVSRGTAYIYAVSEDNEAVRGSYRIKVNETAPEIAYLTVDGNPVTQAPVSVENGKGLTFIAYDASGNELDVTWIVENEDRTGNVTYATISGRGYFKATMADSFKEATLVRVTARVIAGNDELGALVNIIPVSSPIKQIPADKVYFDKKTATIYANGNIDNYINLGKLVHVIGKNKAEPSDPSLTWTSSNKNVASVDYCGVVTALSTGGKAKAVTTITAKTADGSKKKATFKIVVENRPVELTLVSAKATSDIYASSSGTADYQYKKLSLPLGKSFSLKAVITPAVTNNKVAYESFNTKIAEVSDKGKVAAKGIGSTTILARTAEGNLMASLEVTVTAYAKSIKLNSKTLKLGVGNQYQLKAEVKPLNGSQKCTFASENTDIAIVDSKTGLVTALYEGTTNIIATSYDGSKKAQCKVVVGNAVKTIKVTGKKDCVAKNKKIKMTPVFNNGDADRVPINKEVIWSMVEGVGTGQASIDSKTGALTGISCGTVKVKCTCALDDTVYGISDYIMVYVPVKKASINSKTVKLYPDAMYQLKVTFTPDSKDSGKSVTLKKDVTYSLKNKADEAYVSVDATTGLVTAKKKTKKAVVVVATYTPYGSKAKTLQCKVTVK